MTSPLYDFAFWRVMVAMLLGAALLWAVLA